MLNQEIVLFGTETYVNFDGAETVFPVFKTHFSDGKWSFVLHVKQVTQDEVRDSIEGDCVHCEGYGCDICEMQKLAYDNANDTWHDHDCTCSDCDEYNFERSDDSVDEHREPAPSSMVRITAQTVETVAGRTIFGEMHTFPLVENNDEAELAHWVVKNWQLCH
jgi:hypothetical protein